MTDFDKIAIPALIPITGFVFWLATLKNNKGKANYKTKKELLIYLLGFLVWPVSLLVFALVSFYEYWTNLEDE